MLSTSPQQPSGEFLPVPGQGERIDPSYSKIPNTPLHHSSGWLARYQSFQSGLSSLGRCWKFDGLVHSSMEEGLASLHNWEVRHPCEL